jgi:hypothetical protein
MTTADPTGGPSSSPTTGKSISGSETGGAFWLSPSSDAALESRALVKSGSSHAEVVRGDSSQDVLTALRGERSELLSKRRLTGLSETEQLLLDDIERSIERAMKPRLEEVRRQDAEVFKRLELAMNALLAAK